MGIKNIYITTDKKFEGVQNLPLLSINYLDFQIDLESFEFIIFTSKNGVIALDKMTPIWKTKKILAISEQTANQVNLLGGKCSYVGQNGHGNNFAFEILEIVKNSKSLYIRPREVANDLDQIFTSNQIDYKYLIAYETSCNKEIADYKFQSNSIFIFTSPKTVKCFFEKFDWDNTFFAVCIGLTTQKVLPHFVKSKTSDVQNFESCIALAEEIYVI